MFDRPNRGECALIVDVRLSWQDDDESLQEFAELAEAAGAEVVETFSVSPRRPEPKFLITSGKVEELSLLCRSHHVELVLFSQSLSPSQERELEKRLQCRVLDRSGLILDIFAGRAATFEGKLQVELAQLQHLSTRLVRGWTHLERQKGGIGLRGPGETQLETDRRLLRDRIKQIQQKLERVRKRREQSRQSRQKSDLPTLSLVGYTNAGKSTLFNTLTDSTVYADDMVFATLDPSVRRLPLEKGRDAAIIDTVGFVRRLPHTLVEAFHATLQETVEADLLLHVIDASNPDWRDRQRDVNEVLEEIGANETPTLLIFNKIDALNDDEVTSTEPRIDRDDGNSPLSVWCSAQKNQGLDLLLTAIVERLNRQRVNGELVLLPSQSRVRAALFEAQAIVSEVFDESGEMHLFVEMDKIDWQRLAKREGLDENLLIV